MRILYHHRTLADGAEGIHIHEMVEAFRGLGHDVQMMAAADARERGSGATEGWPARIKAALPPVFFELASLAYNLVEFLGTLVTILRNRPDAVYKRHALYDVGVITAASWLGSPIILEANSAYSTHHNQRYEKVTFRRLARWCERWALNHATLTIAVSTPMAQALRSLARRPGDILVVPNGANADRFRPAVTGAAPSRQRLPLPHEAVVVGWSGILREWHRVDLLLDAVAGVPGVHILVVGDGPDRDRFERRASDLGLSDRVHITGRVSHAEVPANIGAFDIAVVAHDGTGYASPMKLLEYMAMGLPVIAPDLPNIRDIVTPDVDGLLFVPGDPKALAQAIGRVAGDHALRTRLGQAARRKVEHERNWTAIARTVLAALDSRHRPGR